jgi:hypothetical protein
VESQRVGKRDEKKEDNVCIFEKAFNIEKGRIKIKNA